MSTELHPWIVNRDNHLSNLTIVKELIGNYRLAVLLAWRSIAIKSRQAFLGHLWPFLQPLVAALIFLLVFNKIAGIDTEPVPYILFAYTGTMIWNFTNTAALAGTNAILNNAGVVSMMYVPRVVLPASACIAPLYNLLISSLVLVALLIIFKVELTLAMLTVPIWILLVILMVFGYSLVFGTLNVIYRDLGQVSSYVCQLWMYLSPIAYPSALVSDSYKALYFMNPLAGIVEGFRWSILGTPLHHYAVFSILSVFLFLLSGFFIFGKFERTLADSI